MSRPNPALLKSFRTRARLALYGTISLCAISSWESFTAQSTLIQAARENNRDQFRYGLELRKRLQQNYVCSRKNLDEGRYYTLITSIWNHGSGVHFLGNMLGLWSFGRVIAYSFGAGTFMTVFYGGGLVGNLLCLLMDDRVEKKMAQDGDGKKQGVGREKMFGGRKQEDMVRSMSMMQDPRDVGFIGASGGVCAMTAANACLNPRGSMIIGIMFIPVPVPNWLGALGFAGFSAWAQTNNFEEGVAHLGHLGGLLYGALWFFARFRGLSFR